MSKMTETEAIDISSGFASQVLNDMFIASKNKENARWENFCAYCTKYIKHIAYLGFIGKHRKWEDYNFHQKVVNKTIEDVVNKFCADNGINVK